MDVILLNGGITEASLIQRYIGPYKIAHWCRKHGYDTQVLDFVEICNEKMLYNMIKKFITPKTLVIGVSTTFMSVNTFMWSSGDKHLMPEAIYKALKKIKEEYNGIKIILGGYMSEKFPGYNLFDATIMSYYEATEEIFVEYLNHLRTGSEPPLGQIQFPLFKSKPRMVYSSARNKIYNIEYDDFKFTKNDYILPGEPLPLDISRGCIFACRFCQFPHIGKKKLDYIRGMEYIESEILHNYENFGTTSYYVLDDTFNDTEQKLSEFNKMVQRLPFKLTYSAYIRADLVHRFPNTVDLLRESGLTGAYHGIESFHPEASKLVGKAWSGKEGKEFLPKLYHDLWGKNVAMHCNFIIGLTGESKDSIKSTIKWFLKNDTNDECFEENIPKKQRRRYEISKDELKEVRSEEHTSELQSH